MARQVRSRMGWNGRNSNEVAHGTGFLGVVRSILGLNQGADGSASCNIHGYIEDSKVTKASQRSEKQKPR